MARKMKEKPEPKSVKKIRVKATQFFEYYSLATLRLIGDIENEDFRKLKAGGICDVDERIVKMYPILFEKTSERSK